MNAWQKLYQKWWGGCNAIRVKSSGTFNLYPTETPCNGVQAIQVMFPDAKTRSWQSVALNSYYLEYRAPIGFDDGLTPQVLVHTGVDPILPTQTNPQGRQSLDHQRLRATPTIRAFRLAVNSAILPVASIWS